MNPAALPFVNPGFVWAAAAAGLIPIIIYILNRRRHRVVPWAAMRFLLMANRKSVRRTRLEQLLLLIMRTLLVVVLGLAIARPFLKTGAMPGLLTSGTHHVFVLDNSFSMSAADPSGSPPPSAFEIQREQALQVLRDLPHGDPITVITQGYPARALNRRATFDHSLVRQFIQSLPQGQAHNDLHGALTIVQSVVADARQEQREQSVYVFSDFARAVLQGGPSPEQRSAITALARDVGQTARLALYDVFDGDTANMANTDLRLDEALVAARQAVVVGAEIANRSGNLSADARLQLLIDDRLVREWTVAPLEPGETRSWPVGVEFDTPGWHTIESRLHTAGSDAVALDNIRRRVVEVRERAPILIVDGKPGADPLRGQAGYLATALAPEADLDSPAFVSPTVISETRLQTHGLSEYVVCVLCNVRRLHEQTWQRLEEFVSKGGGLVVFLGDLVDLPHYNTSGRNLLPGKLVGLAYEALSDDVFVNFDSGNLDGPMLAPFKARPASGLFRARVHQFVKTDPAFGSDRTLLAYTDGQAAVTERRVGSGRCILMNTSANMDWNNLPAKGDFVTLAMTLVRHAAPPNAPQRNLVVGDDFSAKIPTLPGRGLDYVLQRPDGGTAPLEITSLESGFLLRCPGLEHCGWFNLQTPELEGPVAVNAWPAESDLTPLTEGELRDALDCPFEYISYRPTAVAAAGTRTTEATSAMIYAVLLFLLLEALLALKFGHQNR